MTKIIKELSKQWNIRFSNLENLEPNSTITKVSLTIGKIVCIVFDILGSVVRVILLGLGIGIAVTAWAIAELINGIIIMLNQLK